jgi:hypothetical protein
LAPPKEDRAKWFNQDLVGYSMVDYAVNSAAGIDKRPFRE